jgi:adenylate cyclase
MLGHASAVALSYGLALFVLTVYGVEVCPFIEGLGYTGLFPVLCGGFAIGFAVRSWLSTIGVMTPLRALYVELAGWVLAGVGVTLYDTVVLGFPLGSGAKVIVGCLALGLPMSSYIALLVEHSMIVDAQSSGARMPPSGPAWSISSRLYRFVLASQVLLAIVLVLLVAKDFVYVVEEMEAGRRPAFMAVAVEIGGAFLVLLAANTLAARRYALNLDLLLRGQLAGMDAVTEGHLDAVVPVVSNDELARIGDRTNVMIETLRERERIKAVFGKLVSPHVARAILGEADGAELGGREVDAVVLFTDLRNFTTLSERSDPQGVVAFLNEYFTMIVGAVHAEGGVVDKFIGDAAMAVFGLEGGEGAEDASERAMRAALAMRVGLAPVNARLAERGLPQVNHGVGLHWGAMVAGNIGSADRLEYTVIGDAVNTASRLESLCKELGNPLLVSAACHARLSPELQGRLVSLGPCNLKGKSSAVEVFGLGAD